MIPEVKPGGRPLSSTTTAWRYVEEVVELLSARSPTLARALRAAARDGLTHVVLDGTLVHTDRVAADRPYFSDKHRVHGMNVQVVTAPDGTPLWVSGAFLGSVHDVRAAHLCGVLRRLAASGLVILADKGYVGAGHGVITPFKGRNKPEWKKQINSEHARWRGPGERANAELKKWQTLRKMRCCPLRAGQTMRAVLVLHEREAK